MNCLDEVEVFNFTSKARFHLVYGDLHSQRKTQTS